MHSHVDVSTLELNRVPWRARLTEHSNRKGMIPCQQRNRLKANAIAAVFSTHTEAEQAVKELQRAGMDMTTLSIVGKEYEADQDVMSYYWDLSDSNK
jgi:hypothetical protein